MTGDWPTQWTPWLLLSGLGPLGYSSYLAFFSRYPEGLSLRFWAVAITWGGYHASPLLAYVFDILWTGRPLPIEQRFVDSGLLLATLANVCLLVGYSATSPNAKAIRTSNPLEALSKVRVSNLFFVFLMVFYVTMFLVSINGIQNVWVADYPRGEFEWLTRDSWWHFRYFGFIACKILSPIIAAIATIRVLRSDRKNGTADWILMCFAIALATLSSAHAFSRTAGLPLIISSALILNSQKRHRWKPVLIGFLLGGYLSMIGMTQREHFEIGLGNFLEATTCGVSTENKYAQDGFDLGAVNPIRAIERYTYKLEIKELEQPNVLTMGGAWLRNLHPFPSALVPLVPIGTTPTEHLGLVGISGVPAPVLGELYYVFGYAGCLVMIFMGGAYGWFDRLRMVCPSIVTSICYFLCVASIGSSIHAGSRAWTRYVFYAAIIFFLSSFLRRRKQSSSKAIALRNRQGRNETGPRSGGASVPSLKKFKPTAQNV